LEHVLPQNPSDDWAEMDAEIAAIYFNRMGNLVLLQQRANSELGNVAFDEKRAVFIKSDFVLTPPATGKFTRRAGRCCGFWHALRVDRSAPALAALGAGWV
jgi:hypothetical protein